MKILLTGSNGMLGSSLVPILKQMGHTPLSTDINLDDAESVDHLDIRDFFEVEKAVRNFKPDLVMHLAAETDVDVCEMDVDHAFKTNAIGTQNIALSCKKYCLPILYMSSVGVFDGKKNSLYIESDEPKPINTYGVTKLEGEKIVRNLVPNHFIVRSGWMFGGGPKKDKKFIGKIIKQIKDGSKELTIVNDKIGTPTYTYELSRHLEKLIQTELWGTYHCCCKGVCTRVDVAKEILKNLKLNERILVKEVSSANYPLPAPRPYSECMDNLVLRLRGMDEMPYWMDCVQEYMKMFSV